MSFISSAANLESPVNITCLWMENELSSCDSDWTERAESSDSTYGDIYRMIEGEGEKETSVQASSHGC